MGNVKIGTCGYSYKDWVGPFYTEGTKSKDYLPYYSSIFPILEVDYTYYQMPKAENLKNMVDEAGPSLTFSLKATETLTHTVDPHNWKKEAKLYITAIEPIRSAGRLDAILFQFPASFRYKDYNRRYLSELLEVFSGVPAAVEFRNSEWSSKSVLDGLKKRSVTLVAVDLPNMFSKPPEINEPTTPLAYYRLHGRNSENWQGTNSTARYDYLYNDHELSGIVQRVKCLAEKADRLHIFFNNHARGQAPQNAITLKNLLDNEKMLL